MFVVLIMIRPILFRALAQTLQTFSPTSYNANHLVLFGMFRARGEKIDSTYDSTMIIIIF